MDDAARLVANLQVMEQVDPAILNHESANQFSNLLDRFSFRSLQIGKFLSLIVGDSCIVVEIEEESRHPSAAIRTV